jgi:hypothetical protein
MVKDDGDSSFFIRAISGKKEDDDARGSFHRKGDDAEMIRESAMIRFGGTQEQYNAISYHRRKEMLYNQILTSIERINIEQRFCDEYPQAEKVLVEDLKRLLQRNLQGGAPFPVQSEVTAIMMALENKVYLPFAWRGASKIDDVHGLVDEVCGFAEKNNFWHGGFDSVVKVANFIYDRLKEKKDGEERDKARGYAHNELRDLSEDYAQDRASGVPKISESEAYWEKMRLDMGDVSARPLVIAHKKQKTDRIDWSCPVHTELPKSHCGDEDVEVDVAERHGADAGSGLRRQLKLEAAAAKRKRGGKLDMQEVRRELRRGAGTIKTNRIFERRSRTKGVKHNVVVLMDMSGSMSEHSSKTRAAKQALATIHFALDKLSHVEYSLRGFAARNRPDEHVVDIVFRECGGEFTDVGALSMASIDESNRDGTSIRHAVKTCLDGRSGNKMLIVISDGQPNHDDTEYEGEDACEDTRRAIKEAMAGGIKVLGISIDSDADDFIKSAYPVWFSCYGRDMESLPDKLVESYIAAMHGKEV